MSKTAIVLGATGLTGGLLLPYLENSDQYTSIRLISRRKIEHKSSKISVHIGDLMDLERMADDFEGHDLFICIGTTAKVTPDKEKYRAIDYGIPVAAARIAKAKGIERLMVVSAMGADANSAVFYNKTKGEMERDVLAYGPEQSYIFQPALINGTRTEFRMGERFAIGLFKLINPLLVGPLRKYRMIDAEDISKAMFIVAQKGYSESRILSDKIALIAKTGL